MCCGGTRCNGMFNDAFARTLCPCPPSCAAAISTQSCSLNGTKFIRANFTRDDKHTTNGQQPP